MDAFQSTFADVSLSFIVCVCSVHSREKTSTSPLDFYFVHECGDPGAIYTYKNTARWGTDLHFNLLPSTRTHAETVRGERENI